MTTTGRRALVAGSRGSALALAQTNLVIAALQARDPTFAVRVERITTTGDARPEASLSAIGGRGVFVDAIEEALRAGAIDFAVHSAKDLPARLSPDLTVAAFLERADPRDVIVSRVGMLGQMPPGARVGTSSPRRACQLRAVRPDIDVREMRGNVDTRLRKLDQGDYDALVLAGAGLVRLGLASRVTEWLDPALMLPSVGQGALAVQIRADDHDLAELIAPLDHAPTSTALAAERAFLARLGAGCTAAVGAYATLDAAGIVTLDAFIGAPDGRSVRDTARATAIDALAIGEQLADRILAAGGARFLEEASRG